MDVHRLRILRELADRGTVAATARAMDMTPSAVSQQLKVLAREAGVDLLEPDGRRVRLTDAGLALVVRAESVLGELDRARAEMERYRSTPTGVVRLTLFPSAAELLLPGVLRRAAAAGVQVLAADADLPGTELPAMLADADVVVAHRDERAPALGGPRIASRILMREPIDLVVPVDHPLAAAGRVDASQLADLDWISVRDGFPVDDVLRSLATLTGVQPRVVQRINDFHTIQAMVAAGLGVALVARHAVTHPRVRGLEIVGVLAARILEVATRPGAERRPAVAAVLRALDEEVAAVHADGVGIKQIPTVDRG
ncbi:MULTISPECIES: LysR family transcriptional regulator [Tsukamurella]|uniref:LysR family transcriptional regulator n=2 Tax=Tsukamurella TaxID=2060 RepID=A0AA90NLH7_9ACTN|nr:MULTISPECIES: LysR family transcriptional regulator [Tsukamurella]MDP0399854.1 LysR family transcriptional regulator [Tsukamurella strandjordii]GIZ97453.1 putative transcriptional regulator, LysR family protein [Tsukamurella sp. TY48]